MLRGFARSTCVIAVWLTFLLLAGVAQPRPAQAIPVFANGQGVSCGQRHSAPPNLNAYGRYILATNFALPIPICRKSYLICCSRGNASLQVGDFPTPFFAPWLSQSLSLSGYALAAMPVGLNAVGAGDNRWGLSYTQIGTKGLIANVAYMNNSTAAAEGQSFVASLHEMNIASHFTGGIATLRGTFPLPSGTQDDYSRTMGLVSYSTALCHRANGGGGAGPDLHGIAKRKSMSATIAFIEAPSGGMPKLYPSVLSAAQVQTVADYISRTFR